MNIRNVIIIGFILLSMLHITKADRETDVYRTLLTKKVVNIQDVRYIHSKLNVHNDTGNKGNITLAGTEIVSINIYANKDNEKKYLLLHEIAHRYQIRYNKKIPLIATSSYSKISPEEEYAESFAIIYYK